MIYIYIEFIKPRSIEMTFTNQSPSGTQVVEKINTGTGKKQ